MDSHIFTRRFFRQKQRVYSGSNGRYCPLCGVVAVLIGCALAGCSTSGADAAGADAGEAGSSDDTGAMGGGGTGGTSVADSEALARCETTSKHLKAEGGADCLALADWITKDCLSLKEGTVLCFGTTCDTSLCSQ